MRRPRIASLVAIAAMSLPLLAGTTTPVAASPRTTPRLGTQLAELKGSDTATYNFFGGSVAISGTTAVVGAPGHARGAGRAYVFTRTAGAWKPTAELKGSDTVAGDLFGGSVAISGTTVVVGAEDHALAAGRAYVFTKVAGVWKQAAELKGSDTVAADTFGSSVAVSGTTVVVGAEGRASFAGRVYLFTKARAGWKQAAQLKGTDTVASDYYSDSVAISGTTVVVGAENHAHFAGRAYVFTKVDGVWKQTAELKGSDTVARNYFGDSVAISGTTVMVGASSQVGKASRAYVFTKAGAGWKQADALKGSDTVAGDGFGWSVGISGTTAVVGAPYYRKKAGRAYVFTKSAGVWKQTAALEGSDTVSGNVFGFVAISGTTAVVGAPDYHNFAGRAYVFEV
ncbi:MAG: FG-GAP repeat protein [Acidimicrobiales bacterium]